MTLWQHILNRLQEQQRLYLLTVIENFGSTPGRKGFKMLVAQDNFIFGSVGGGVMEFALVEEAQKLQQTDKPPSFIKKQIHKGNIKDGSGMICSGEQTVAFMLLDAGHIRVIEKIIDCLKSKTKGTLNMAPGIFDITTESIDHQFEYEINSKKNWFYKERLGFNQNIYIVGGGHVGVAVSELFARLGFHVVVIDNRHQLNTLEDNQFAHRKLVVDYQEVDQFIPENDDTYIAVMTNKYTDDRLVVSKLLRTKHAFLGVLGSKAKLKTMWKDLKKEGFSQGELDTIHAPIGLAVKSQTPEEIAVSIAAQIIQVKNRHRK